MLFFLFDSCDWFLKIMCLVLCFEIRLCIEMERENVGLVFFFLLMLIIDILIYNNMIN